MSYSKRSLGQNFLIDKNIIKKIINLINLKDKNVIEIGPGKGALTGEILKKNPKSLIVIEKDTNLAKFLKFKFSNNKNFTVFNQDILKIDLEKIQKEKTVIFGNLPYNISSQILVKIIKFKKWPPKSKNIIFMFQKELGEKIIGEFKKKGYGRLSIITNYRMGIIDKFLVSPNCFSPKPKVKSMVIHFRPKEKFDFKITDINNLERVTNIFFSNKRKMINKTILRLDKKEEILKINGLNPKFRPDEINPDIYYKISEIISK